MEDDEFQRLKRAANSQYRLLLVALRETGARPSELRQLTWDQVKEDRLLLREHKTTHKVQKPRMISLTPKMQRLLKLLNRRRTSDYVFLNTRGNPWTRDAVHRQLCRLRKKLELADDICPYMVRHTYGTNGVANGADVIALAINMDHEDTTMLHKTYAHAAQMTAHLVDAAVKAAGNRSGRVDRAV